MKKIIRTISVMLTLAVVLLTAIPALAVDTYNGYSIPVDVAVNGVYIKCAQKPVMINWATYIPLRSFGDAIGANVQWNGADQTVTISKGANSAVFYYNAYCSVINGAWSTHAAVNHNGLLFIPAGSVYDIFGYGVEWDDAYLTVKITAPGVVVPAQLIDYTYSYEDIYYLGKITQVESGYQDFKVKLGVANTVINRKKSTQFPNTIKDVIFDTKYSVQFPPAHTAKMNVTPSKDTLIATKCALNGVNPVGNSLYFIDTAYASKSWAHKNRPFYGTIVDMNFYE